MRAGWKGLFAIEKDPFAFDTLATNFSPRHGRFSYDWPSHIEMQAWDIRDLLRECRSELSALAGKIDLLAGGPPCQGFSQAGRRQLDDPRNRLFESYLDLVEILRPRLVVIENVKGFTSSFKRSASTKIENFAAELCDGLSSNYHLMSEVIQTREFGIPQARSRFFIVGSLKSTGCSSHIDMFFHNLKRDIREFLLEHNLPLNPTAKDAIGDLEICRNGTVPSVESKGFVSIAYDGPYTSYQRAMRDGYRGDPPDTRLARHRPYIQSRFAEIIRACREEGRLNITISPAIRNIHGLKKTAIRVLDPLDASPTITSLPDDLLHYSEPRTLTVRENARLQSFPDWFTFKGNYTTGGRRRRREAPRFTQVANAVPPLLAEQFGLGLLRLAANFISSEDHPEVIAYRSESCPMLSEVPSECYHPRFVDCDHGTSATDRT